MKHDTTQDSWRKSDKTEFNSSKKHRKTPSTMTRLTTKYLNHSQVAFNKTKRTASSGPLAFGKTHTMHETASKVITRDDNSIWLHELEYVENTQTHSAFDLDLNSAV